MPADYVGRRPQLKTAVVSPEAIDAASCVIRQHFGHNRGAEACISGGSVIRREKAMRSWLGSLAVFVLVLAVLKFFFGWNISIIGSVVLTIILTLVFSLFNRR